MVFEEPNTVFVTQSYNWYQRTWSLLAVHLKSIKEGSIRKFICKFEFINVLHMQFLSIIAINLFFFETELNITVILIIIELLYIGPITWNIGTDYVRKERLLFECKWISFTSFHFINNQMKWEHLLISIWFDVRIFDL